PWLIWDSIGNWRRRWKAEKMDNKVETELLTKLKEYQDTVVTKFKEQGEESERKIEAAVKGVKDELMPLIRKNIGAGGVKLSDNPQDDYKDFKVSRLIRSLVEHKPDLAAFEHEVCKKAWEMSIEKR